MDESTIQTTVHLAHKSSQSESFVVERGLTADSLKAYFLGETSAPSRTYGRWKALVSSMLMSSGSEEVYFLLS